MKLDELLESERDVGHVEIHVIPMHDPKQRRIVMAIGGNVVADEAQPLGQIPAALTRLFTQAAIQTQGGILPALWNRIRGESG